MMMNLFELFLSIFANMNVTLQTPFGIMLRYYEKDWTGECLSFEIGMDESNKSCFRVQNACGVIYVESSNHIILEHSAWKKCPSIFGMVYKAFSIAGNFIVQKKRISFKGVADPAILKETLTKLVVGNYTYNLQLFVASVGIGRCLKVEPGCLLENKLKQYRWVRVLPRLQEVCNVVVFYIQDWKLMNETQNKTYTFPNPKSCTISVTRRGTVTVRITWTRFFDWNNNDNLKVFCEDIAGFVRMNV